jgi:hypothetical protein
LYPPKHLINLYLCGGVQADNPQDRVQLINIAKCVWTATVFADPGAIT